MPKTRTRNVEKTCFTVVVTRCADTPPHTATGKAAVAVPGHSQAVILGTKFDTCFGNCFWSQLCAMIFTISSPAGRSFFGRRAAFCHHFRSQFWAPFLVPVLGTRLPPDTRIINEPCICDPILGTRSGPQNGTPKPHNSLPRNPDTFQSNFEKNLTKKPKKLETRKR